jgi:predicted RNA polymerase sigma factor
MIQYAGIPYRVPPAHAAVAACHVTARTAADTDWRQIAALYGQLKQTPVVALNRAVAIGMADGPAVDPQTLGLHSRLHSPRWTPLDG